MQSLLMTIIAIWGLAVVTPGANSLLIMRTAATLGRQHGIICVAGIILATAIWGILGELGVNQLMAQSPWLFQLLQLVGGSYLVYLGVRQLWQLRADKSAEHKSLAPSRSLLLSGFLTNILNPKAPLFMVSLFSLLPQPQHVAHLLSAAITIAMMVLLSALWYSLLAHLAASQFIRHSFRPLGKFLQYLTALTFIGFGVHLVLAKIR